MTALQMASRLALLATVLVCNQACVADVEPDIGPLRAGVCTADDSDPAAAVSFREDILPLLKRPFGMAGCSCHQPSSRRTSGIDSTGLDLGTYTALMRGGDSSGDTIVIPGDPCGSVLVQKISTAPPSGARMPSDGPPYMTPNEIMLIRDWIAEGASEN